MSLHLNERDLQGRLKLQKLRAAQLYHEWMAVKKEIFRVEDQLRVLSGERDGRSTTGHKFPEVPTDQPYKRTLWK